VTDLDHRFAAAVQRLARRPVQRQPTVVVGRFRGGMGAAGIAAALGEVFTAMQEADDAQTGRDARLGGAGRPLHPGAIEVAGRESDRQGE
jgi:hypothetical protein